MIQQMSYTHMPYVLKLHPDSQCPAVAHITVDLERNDRAQWLVTYSVTGKISELRMPPVGNALRSDDLWQHTCFEAFIRTAPGREYYEFNVSPSTQWAAYRFTDYRSGRTSPAEIDALPIEVQSEAGRLVLKASLPLTGLPDFQDKLPVHLGLSAIIEDASGAKSYWALAHPAGKPDFHHSDGFAIELSADGPE
jgi:hypothetical protein